MSPIKSERGASLIVFTILTAFVIMPLMGLGIDASIQYWIKARLSAAVDSAALAAARSLSLASSASAQAPEAQSVGTQYFLANFPTGVLGTTLAANNPVITVVAPSNYITVTVTAQVSAPLYFMRMLHFSAGTIVASSQSTRRNANVVLVLDRSGSMNKNGSCSALVADVQSFASQFIDGRDNLALVTFSTAAELDYGPTTNFKSDNPSLSQTIGTLVCVGATSSEQGLSFGYQAIKAINQPGALNVIVFFTDGGANTVKATYPIKTFADSNSRYDYVSTSTYNNYPASSCNGSDVLLGVYTDVSDSLNATGYTAGVIDSTPTGISGGSGNPPAISAPGCLFTNNSNAFGWGPGDGRADVAYIPGVDSDLNPTSGTGYKVPLTYPSGPYASHIRADSPQAIRYAAMNVADYKASLIHADTTYAPVIYTVGLSGNEAIPMDTDFLMRLANASGASNFNSKYPVGSFYLATDAASLADAFNNIAGEILRLSK